MITKVQKKIIVGIAVVFALVAGAEAVKYLRYRDAVDLCNKLIGARLLEEGIAPYDYYWKEGDPQKFYNPYETMKAKANSITVPPSFLMIMKPFSPMSFSSAKWSWLLISYGLLLGSIFFMTRLVRAEERWWMWSGSLFFFMSSAGWLLHAERGQVYVLYLFLLSAAYFFYKKERIVLSLGFLAVLVWLRLPFLVFVIPYCGFLKNYKIWLAGLGYSAGLVLITWAGSDPEAWLGYWKAVGEWSTAQILQSDIYADARSEAWRTFIVGNDQGRDYLINNSSIQYLAQYHFKIKLFPGFLWILLLAGSVLLFGSLRRFFHKEKGSAEILFLVAFLGYIFWEVCLPAPRYNYTYIQWLFPFLILIPVRHQVPLRMEGAGLFVLGLLLNMGLFFFLPRSYSLGEGIMYLSLWWWLWSAHKKTGIALGQGNK